MPTNPYESSDPRSEVLATVLAALDAEQPGATATGYAAAATERLRDEYPDVTEQTPEQIASHTIEQFEPDERLTARTNPTSYTLRLGLLRDMLAEAARRGRGEA